MKLPALILALSLLQPIAWSSPLSDLAEQQGVTWIIGSWASADNKITLLWEWRLDKNAVGIKLTAMDREAEGLIALKPGSQKVQLVSVDNKGDVSTGEFSEYNDHPLLKTTRLTASGEIKTATEYIKVDDDNMLVKIHRQTETGEPGELMFEVAMKRAK